MSAIINSIWESDWKNAQDILSSAGNIIKNGGTVIFPTETVYGLGANALDPRAAKRIYKAKGRPSDNPLIVHISDMEMLDLIARDISDNAKILMEKYWPGPLTMIFYKKEIVPRETTGGLETVAVRMPSNKIAQSIIHEAGVPVAAPSANISGRPSITSGKYAIGEMADRVDMIIISEDSQIGIESTVVDMTTSLPMVLRPGKISQMDILREIAKDEQDYENLCNQYLDLIHDPKSNESEPKSPGMKYKHYSPKAQLYLLSKEEILNQIDQRMILEALGKRSDDQKTGEPFEELQDIVPMDPKELYMTQEAIQQKLQEVDKSKIKVFTNDEHLDNYGSFGISLGQDGEEIGKNLFKLLREMDEQEVSIILCEDFEKEEKESEFLSAVMNRIKKAAHNI